MKYAIVYAMFISVVLLSGAVAQTKKFHSGSPGANKSSGSHQATKSATDEKKVPRSTAPASLNTKSGSAQRNELSRLEHQNSRHLQSQAKHKTAPQSGRVQPVHSKSEGNGSDIKFAYHEPRGSGSKATSGNGTKRHH